MIRKFGLPCVIFAGAGIVQGSLKTWYYVPPEVWRKIREYVSQIDTLNA